MTAYRRSSSKEDFVGFVMLQNCPAVNWSRIYFCNHRLARGAGQLEANWGCGQPCSGQIQSPSSCRESSGTHDGERTGRKFLVSLRRIIESGVLLSETWSAKMVMECHHEYKLVSQTSNRGQKWWNNVRWAMYNKIVCTIRLYLDTPWISYERKLIKKNVQRFLAS